MKSINLYLSENENVTERVDQEGLTFDERSKSNFRQISKKSNNNLIGYYQFREKSGRYCKLFVVPKLLSSNLTDDLKQKSFFEFLKKYLLLKHQYGDNVSTSQIDGSISDLGLSLSKEDISNAKSMEDLLCLKYLEALRTVKKFFQRHKRLNYVNKAYSSQSVRDRIDLAANIRSLDKSSVHQIKKEALAYSKLASISFAVLKDFRREKLVALSSSNEFFDDLTSLAVSNQTFLNRRFYIEKGFSLTLKKLMAHKTVKLFTKNAEHKNLHYSLLVLAGAESFGNGDELTDVHKINNMVSVFFDPAKMYEWIVFDQLKQEYKHVKKDGFEDGTKKEYQLRNRMKGGRVFYKSSKPDFIVKDLDRDREFVVDAKWKIASSFEKILYEDVAKLKRDCKLRNIEFGMLAYPKLPKESEGKWYLEDDELFEFYLKEIPV